MNVTIQGQGDVSLSQNDFVASGGEGSIYARGSTAFKVYSDPGKMIPHGKISELSGINDPNVIKPERVLLDPTNHAPIGYTMRFVKDAMPLCRTFTRAFREREGLDHAKMAALVGKLRDLVKNVHAAGILIVDLNEMNFLVDQTFAEVYGIDVDSYQTRSYRATALMLSVRDWKVTPPDFTEGSDWFSFACVAFQMFTGIHPYKGKHLSGVGLEGRMKTGISVFDPSVSLPKAAYRFDVIPNVYRDWFTSVLRDGKRSPPPADLQSAAIVVAAVRAVLGGNELDIAELVSFSSAVLQYAENAGSNVSVTVDGVFCGQRRVWSGPTPGAGIAFTPKMNRPVIAWVEQGVLRVVDCADGKEVPATLRADEVMSTAGRVYVRSGDKVLELVLTDVSSGVLASTRLAANVLQLATRLFDGVAVQNLLGSVFASVFPRSGETYQLRVPELDAYRVIEARFENRVLMVLAAQGERYDRLTFHLADDYHSYRMLPTVRDVTPGGVNFIVLDNGVCVHLTEEEKLEVTAVGSKNGKVVEAEALGNDMRLVKHAGRVAFIRGDTVHSMRMK
ncbi:MAG: hypothetical protein EXR71_19210 [Myxococcales bacterium]|nr:hypothetical protein [Myxococcales bacterium]